MKISKRLRIVVPVEPVTVGKIGSTYGVHGWLRVFSFTKKAESIFNYQPWFIKIASNWHLIELERWKRYRNDLIIKIKDIKYREKATFLTNCEIIIDALQLPDLDNNEYYWKDILGCRVITIGGYQLGKVVDLIETGSNDVMIVKANLKDAFRKQERLIPFIDGSVIKNVDLIDHVIKVNWDLNF